MVAWLAVVGEEASTESLKTREILKSTEMLFPAATIARSSSSSHWWEIGLEAFGLGWSQQLLCYGPALVGICRAPLRGWSDFVLRPPSRVLRGCQRRRERERPEGGEKKVLGELAAAVCGAFHGGISFLRQQRRDDRGPPRDGGDDDDDGEGIGERPLLCACNGRMAPLRPLYDARGERERAWCGGGDVGWRGEKANNCLFVPLSLSRRRLFVCLFVCLSLSFSSISSSDFHFFLPWLILCPFLSLSPFGNCCTCTHCVSAVTNSLGGFEKPAPSDPGET